MKTFLKGVTLLVVCCAFAVSAKAQNTAKVSDNGNKAKVETEEKTPFPQFKDTGNPEQDKATYYAAKKKWVAENPKEYQELNERPKVVTEKQLLKMHPKRQATLKADPKVKVVK